MHLKHKIFYALTAVIAVVDIGLFLLPYFEEDVDVFEAEPPLPKNDFRRMVNFWKGTGGEGFRGSKQVSEKGACDCNPIETPSASVKCYIGGHGAMQTTMIRVAHDLQFKCKRMSKQTCQCCDCGTEEKTLTFTGADIAKQGICEECEKPAKIGNPGAAHFAKGQVYQMLFKLPLGCDAAAGGSSSQESCLQYDYQALNLDIQVDGNFSHSWDNDLMIGFMDGASTVWAGQRGDNGIWFNIGKLESKKLNDTSVGIFNPHSLGYARYGSRSSRFSIRFFQNNQGNGATMISMDNDMTTHKAFKTKARWRQAGWKSTGRAKDLQLVAFRDDHDEVYEIHKVTVKYQKAKTADPDDAFADEIRL